MPNAHVAQYMPRIFLIFLFLWGMTQWEWARPTAAAADWMGWRQADTQAMVNNFKRSRNDILHPQIDWRKDGPGFVETEFALYPYLASKILPGQTDVEWPAQAISLAVMMLAITLLFAALRSVFGDVPALIAALSAMASLGTLHLATAIQPDGLCFLLYCASLITFYRYLHGAQSSWLAISTMLTLLAALVKPPALHLGLIQFFALLFVAPQRLGRARIWLSWLVILAGFSAYIFFAHQHYLVYGNTFGIGFGGDAKWPTVSELLAPGNYYRLFRLSMTWGVGLAGTVAALFLLAKRQFSGWETALAIGLGAHLLVSMRYSSSEWLASHYHIFGVFLGTWCVAHATNQLASIKSPLFSRYTHLRKWAAGAIITALIVLVGVNTQKRIHHKGIDDGERFLALQAMIEPEITPGERIVVRSTAPARVEGWGNGTNNFEDPRIFYLTQSTGWVLPMDDDEPSHLAQAVAKGAHYYVHMGSLESLPITKTWLEEHAVKLKENAFGSLYHFVDAAVVERK